MDESGLKIVAPLNLPGEAGPLAAEGADELYCGFLPPDWLERFSLAVPINRRDAGPGNIRSFEQLCQIVREAHAEGVPLYLTLNGQTYSEGQVAFLREYCLRVAEEAGVDGFLVSDPALVYLLNEWLPGVTIHVSSMAAVHNSKAVEFFHKIGAQRIILPRQIAVREVATIHERVPEVALEVFVLNDGCVLEEGLCSTTHAAGPFCLIDWQYSFRRVGGGRLDGRELANLEANRRSYRRWILCHEASGHMATPTGYPVGPCGLCAVPSFHRAGVHALKVVGRESPTGRKIASVRITRLIRDLVVKGATEGEIARAAITQRQSGDACASGNYCYYPEVTHHWARAVDDGKGAV